jgi:hypothetical protein
LNVDGAKSLRWGILLAWVPLAMVVVPGVFYSFHGITEQKATGLGAVAGGIAEMILTWGVLSFIGVEVASLVFTVRALRGGVGRAGVLPAVASVMGALLALTIVVGGMVTLQAFSH